MNGDILHALPLYWRLIVVALLVAGIVAISVAPGEPGADDGAFSWIVFKTPTFLQKFLHVGVYAVLALLLASVLIYWAERRIALAATVIVCALLGACLEWVQRGVPGRYGTLGDILLNICGATLGTVAAAILMDS